MERGKRNAKRNEHVDNVLKPAKKSRKNGSESTDEPKCLVTKFEDTIKSRYDQGYTRKQIHQSILSDHRLDPNAFTYKAVSDKISTMMKKGYIKKRPVQAGNVRVPLSNNSRGIIDYCC